MSRDFPPFLSLMWALLIGKNGLAKFFVFAHTFIDYADTMSAYSHLLCGTTMTMQTLTANFEGFSPTLKEQSAEIKYLGVFPYQITLFWKYEKGGGVTKAKIAIKYLCENEEVRAKLFLPVHMRLWQSLLSKIIGWKSRNTVPLRITPTWSFIRNSGFLINLQIGVNNSSMLQQHKLYNIHTVLYCI